MITLLRDHRGGRVELTLDKELGRRRRRFEWLRLFILRMRADALLRRALRRRPRTGRAADLPPHLLKDIGLPPDFRN